MKLGLDINGYFFPNMNKIKDKMELINIKIETCTYACTYMNF